MIPIATAALAGLPVVDGDAMGRAFPEAQMVTFHLAGYGPGATVMVDHHGNEVVSRPVDGGWSERIARAVTVEMGGGATMIDYAYGGDVVRECAIPGTLTLAKRIGRILRGRDAAGHELRDDERIDALCDDLDAIRLFDGKVADLQRAVDGGFTRGAAELDGVGVDRGARSGSTSRTRCCSPVVTGCSPPSPPISSPCSIWPRGCRSRPSRSAMAHVSP